MIALPRVAFAALVAATIAAFFVTQRLKHEPAVLSGKRLLRPLDFSPDGNGYQDRLRIQFGLRRADDVTVSVVSRSTGDVVKHIVTSMHVKAYRQVVLHWLGRTDEGRPAPDGTYRVKVGLRREGRSLTLPGEVRVDRRPPPVKITKRSNEGVVRPGTPVQINFRGTSRRAPKLLVIRTDLPHPRVVAEFDGQTRHRKLLWPSAGPPGVYLLGVETRDAAGNFGHYPATLPNRPIGVGTPVHLPAHLRDAAGVTVRQVAVVPVSFAPVKAGGKISFFIDARGSRYTWDVRRLGSPAVHSSGSGTRFKLTFKSPRGISAVYVLEVRANGGLSQTPFAVENRKPAKQRVLVVLPYITWQARSVIDDKPFDGVPDTLGRGGPVPLLRPLGLPAGFGQNEAPLLIFLDRSGLRYDLTTDAALAAGEGPQLAGHSGVVIAGQAPWTTPALGTALKRYVIGGGKVLLAGTDALRGTATLSNGSLTSPSPLSDTDSFGLRYQSVRPFTGTITAFTATSSLFTGSGGQFTGFTSYEPLASKAGIIGYGGPAPNVRVIAQVALGKGQIIRFGLPQWSSRLSDPAVQGLTRQAWSLLSQ